MLLEKIKQSNDSEPIERGDVICINDEGEAKKVSCLEDTFKIIGICSDIEKGNNGVQIEICVNGFIDANTNDALLEPGDLLVAEVDGTVKCKTAEDDDIDIIGMALSKVIDNKILIKCK